MQKIKQELALFWLREHLKMAKKFRIEYDREACIGAFLCTESAKEFFKVGEDGKADLLNSEKKGNYWVIDFDEKNFEKVLEAAQLCPVNAIHIIDLEKDERII